MNIKSVRFRLTIWYSLVLFMATALIFASFYLVTKQILLNQTDNMLSAHGNNIVNVMTKQNADIHEALAKQVFLQEYSRIPGELVIVMNNEGDLVSTSHTSNLNGNLFLDLLKKAREIKKPFFDNQTTGDLTLRFYVKPILTNGTFAGVILVGSPLDVIQRSLNNLFAILLIFFFFVLSFPTVAGGYFLAGRAMYPIASMSEKLKRISSKNLEERIENPNTSDELENLALNINRLLDRLNAAFKRERQFIGDLAHELKTPLANLRSGVEVTLSKSRTKKEYQNTLFETLIDINKLSSTLKNILDLAWSEADNAATQAEVFSLSEMMEDLKDTAVKMAVQKNIIVEDTIEPKFMAAGKKDKLSRAILNIIDNATKYSHAKSKIDISLKKSDEYATIKIKDTGPGIAKKDLPHIFDRFYRGSNTGKTSGSGLGLAIAKAIISAHRGQINAKSNIGKGTAITIRLPLA